MVLESSANALVGVDVGGSGIKAAVVDLTGGLATGRIRVETPQPPTPEAIAQTVADLVRQLPGTGAIGCTLPAVVLDGIVRTATNIDRSWIGTNAEKVIESRNPDRRCVVLNDADAAGVAEARFGAARGQHGLVAIVTIGTGIGTALLNNGELVPNSELGHLTIDGEIADTWVSDATRTAEDLSWKQWAHRLDRYLGRLHELIWPELIVIGGGIAKHAEKFLYRVDPDCEVRVAELGNLAGIVGAALAAASHTAAATTDRS